MRALELLASMVLEDERPWAETAARFQWDDARVIVDPPGGVRQVFITRPRGGRKTTDLAGVVLAILATQAPAFSRGFVGASDEEQAQELIDAAEGLIRRTPGLAGAFRVTGLSITYLASGARVTALPADASAMGKRPYLIVVDELTNWPETRAARKFWDVLSSAARKVEGCRLVVISNAGSPEHWAAKRLAVAKTSRHWLVRETPGPLPWLTADDLEALRENATVPSEFRRLHLNEWTQAEDALVTVEDLEACTRRGGSLPPVAGIRYVIGVDLGLVNDATVIVVAHREGRRVVLDKVRRFRGTRARPVVLADVEAALLAEHAAYGRARLVLDPWQGAGLAQRLRARSVTVDEFTFSATSVGRLASTLFRLLRDHELELPEDDDLRAELLAVRLRTNSAGALRMDHPAGGHDDQAQALALAAQTLVQRGVPGPAQLETPSGRVPTGGRTFDAPLLPGGGVPLGGAALTGQRPVLPSWAGRR